MDDPWIWIALVLIGFLVFGAKRMPDAARGLGRSLRIFKAETKGLLTDDTPPAPVTQESQQIVAAPVAAAPVVETIPVAAPAPVAVPVPTAEHPTAQ